MKQKIEIVLRITQIVFLAVALMLPGCSSGELTREKAEKLMKPLFPKKMIGEIYITELYSGSKSRTGIFGENEIQELQNNNKSLVDANIINDYLKTIERGRTLEYTVEFTSLADEYVLAKIDEGEVPKRYLRNYENHKQWARYRVISGIFKFTEVTGIFLEDNGNEAVIDYKIMFSPTPFNFVKHPHPGFKSGVYWKWKDSYKGSVDFNEASYNGKMVARKYDDGWRLVD